MTGTQRLTPAMRLSPTRLVLWGLVGLAVVLAALRAMHGIGAISNLNNEFAFGFWISFDLLVGVALAAGAFTTCTAVYIFGLEEFRPLVRPAVLTGFLGYLAVIVALLVDLGRPERIWHMLIYWNVHSPLFEVGMCVMSYTTVLFFEFSPVFFDWLGWKKIGHAIHKVTPVFVILGTVLSTLHQSSLGTLFVMMSDKINPLWHTPFLPLFFFLSAATAGLAMVIFEGTIAAHAYGHPQETPLLGKLARAIPWMLGLLMVLKFSELAWAGDLSLLFKPGLLPTLYWIEMLGGVILPMILLSIKRIRTSVSGLFISASLVIAGLMLNRFDVGLVSWKRPAWSTGYTPSWMEFALSFGVIAALILAYDFVARHMKLFDHGHGHEHDAHGAKGERGASHA